MADITGIPGNRTGFTRAISMYRAHDLAAQHDPLRGGSYSEEAFHAAELEAQRDVRAAVEGVRSMLEREGIACRVPARGQDPQTLVGEFSHKLAATRAGLGWIGRSSLLVTRVHGPRVVLHSVLLDAAIPAAEPVTGHRCGSCVACVEACPYGFVRGPAWESGMDRDLLLDAHGCSEKRVEIGEPLGRKHECGLCMLLCPLGSRL